MRRTTIGTTLAAAVAAGAIATTPALARPLNADYGPGYADPGAAAESQHLYYHQHAAPSWPGHSRPEHAVSTPLPRHAGGGDDTVWIIGLAAGAFAAALSAAGLSRHARVRARRVAV